MFSNQVFFLSILIDPVSGEANFRLFLEDQHAPYSLKSPAKYNIKE